MALNETKRMACLRIYHILKRHSRASKTDKISDGIILTQEMIGKILERDYGIVLERKAISNYVSDLESSEIGVVKTTKGAYYDPKLANDLTESEIHLLIDSVLSSRYLDKKSSKVLIDKLTALTSKHFKSYTKNAVELDYIDKSENECLFSNIQVINECIAQGRMVKFIVNQYGIDKRLHPVEEISISPQRLIIYNNHYYLVGNDNEGVLESYQVDKMTGVKKLLQPKTRAKGDINQYIYSSGDFSQKQLDFVLSMDMELLDSFIDTFGKKFYVSGVKEGRAIVKIKANIDQMTRWAVYYGDKATVIEPQEVRNTIRRFSKNMSRNYSLSEKDVLEWRFESARRGRFNFYGIDLNPHMEKIATLKNVKSVLITNHNKINDLSFLKGYDRLEDLWLSGIYPKSLDFINHLSNLRLLSLSDMEISSLDFLKGNSSIKRLMLHGLRLEDYSPLYEMTGLSELSITSSPYAEERIDTERLLKNNPSMTIYINHFIGYEEGRNIRKYVEK